MRTTLDIDQDILDVAKDLARQRGVSTGKVISELARKGLRPETTFDMKDGIPVFRPKPGATVMTLEMVNRLRDEE
ncbi:MAG: CopG family transcriptional regulator [Acidobacteria bacterium]|nr:CopG family transcriptional regulator [Acidobacteriota bacterium]MBI3279863.1 CopG family transcriptional regulator [Acidobacteriota bacterium]